MWSATGVATESPVIAARWVKGGRTQTASLSPLQVTRPALPAPLGGAATYPRICSRVLPMRRSEEHTSELQSLMRISYAVFCLKKKKKINIIPETTYNKHTNIK